MKYVSCWRKPSATTTDYILPACFHRVLITGPAQKKLIDDLSNVWLSVRQEMVAVQQGHPLRHQRPPATPAMLVAVPLELQRLSMHGPRCHRQSDVSVDEDEEVSRLLCHQPPRQQSAAGRCRTKRRVVDGRDVSAVGDRTALTASWAEFGVRRDKTSPCRLRRFREHFKRPCLDFNKMQASQSLRRWLQLRLRLDCDSTAVRLPFDCIIRPCYDHSTTMGLPVCGPLHCGLNKQAVREAATICPHPL